MIKNFEKNVLELFILKIPFLVSRKQIGTSFYVYFRFFAKFFPRNFHDIFGPFFIFRIFKFKTFFWKYSNIFWHIFFEKKIFFFSKIFLTEKYIFLTKNVITFLNLVRHQFSIIWYYVIIIIHVGSYYTYNHIPWTLIL